MRRAPREARPRRTGEHGHPERCTGRGILCAWRIGRPNLRRGARHRDGPVPNAQSLGARRSVAAHSPVPVIWSGLVVIKLLRYRMTINDHAAARDSKADRRCHKRGFATFTESPISDVRAAFSPPPYTRRTQSPPAPRAGRRRSSPRRTHVCGSLVHRRFGTPSAHRVSEGRGPYPGRA